MRQRIDRSRRGESENELESSSTELVFEFLQDHQMLNKKGLKLRKSFWEQFIKH